MSPIYFKLTPSNVNWF